MQNDALSEKLAEIMVAKLQLLKQRAKRDDPNSTLALASIDLLKEAAREYFDSNGNNLIFADLLGIEPLDYVRAGEEARAQHGEKVAELWTDLINKMSSSTAKKVNDFSSYLDVALVERYPDAPSEEIQEMKERYMSAFIQDHGKPLFDAAGMRELAFPGNVAMEAAGYGDEYKDIKRIFQYGCESHFKKRTLFERHVKHLLREDQPTYSEELIDAKYAEVNNRESYQLSFGIKWEQREKFLSFVKATLQSPEYEAEAELYPAALVHKREILMTSYDHDHFPTPTRLQEEPHYQQVYEEFKAAYEAASRGRGKHQ